MEAKIIAEVSTSVKETDGFVGSGRSSTVWLIVRGVGSAILPYPLDRYALLTNSAISREITTDEKSLPRLHIDITGESTGDVIKNSVEILKSGNLRKFKGVKIGEIRGSYYPCAESEIEYTSYF